MSDDESEFKKWYAEKSRTLNLDPNPDDPRHFYDYRAAYHAGAGPDSTGHWPSEFKKLGHPRLILGGIDTRTGQPANALLARQNRKAREKVKR